jgi:signal transduction histidine kinase/CheY-like chemotaxis protein
VSEAISTALGRALAYCCGVGDGSLEGFVDRATWELHNECVSEFSSLAIIVRRGDGSSFVGRLREVPALPVETLLGMLVEEGGAQLTCRVRDHALDTVRFIDPHFRTSIVLRLAVPKTLLADGEAALWFGLQSSATPKRVELAQTVAATISKWLAIYAPVLLAVRVLGERLSGLRVRLGEMTALAHDAKAPVGALKYLVSDLGVEYPQVYQDAARLEGELLYIEKLLARFSPKGAVFDRNNADASDNASDISAVVHRVCQRFQRESRQHRNRCVIDVGFGASARAKVPEFDLERVVSNVIGNAVRYSNPGDIVIALESADKRINGLRPSEAQWIIRVRDQGPGIPQSVIDQMALADVPSGLDSASGWGVGLMASRSVLVAHGGELTLRSTSAGSEVDMIVPADLVHRHNLQVGHVFKSEVASPGPVYQRDAASKTEAPELVILVDDDYEHTLSLERLLLRRGFAVKSFAAVDLALEKILNQPAVSVLCDANMPDGGAKRLLQLIAESGARVPFAVMSGEVNDELLYHFAALGAREFFAKPIDVETLVSWVGRPEATLPF